MSDSSIGLVIGAIWNPHKLGEYYARIERIYGNDEKIGYTYPFNIAFDPKQIFYRPLSNFLSLFEPIEEVIKNKKGLML